MFFRSHLASLHPRGPLDPYSTHSPVTADVKENTDANTNITMKIAVTGCNGSVGTRVVLAALAQGHTVVGIDSAPVPDALTHLDVDAGQFAFHRADLREYDAGLRLLEGCDAVVHLAAMRTPGDYVVAAHNT